MKIFVKSFECLLDMLKYKFIELKIAKFRVVILLFIVITLFINSSSNGKYVPVLMKYSELAKSVKFLDSQNLTMPGKIYYKDKYLFISDRYKGIHIFDNSNPEKPIKIGFIKVPGCLEIAIKNNILYTDNSVDLVAIDLNSISDTIIVTQRLSRVLSEPLPPDALEIPHEFRIANRPKNTVIIEWRLIY